MPIKPVRVVVRMVFWTPTVDDVNRSILVRDSTEYAKRLLAWSLGVIQEHDFNDVAYLWGCHNEYTLSEYFNLVLW